MSNQERDGTRSTTREQLIDNSMARVHERRTEVNQCRMIYDGFVPRKVLLRFQSALIEFYWAMRPLRDENAVRDHWDAAVLSNDWTRTVEKTEVDASLYGGRPSVKSNEVEEPFSGLDTLEWLEDQTETVEVDHESMRGKSTGTKTRQVVLSPKVLVDISGALDDAADKLGFAPEVPEKTHTDKVTKEEMMEIFAQNKRPAVADGGSDV